MMSSFASDCLANASAWISAASLAVEKSVGNRIVFVLMTKPPLRHRESTPKF
jgi:hypothetical protein